MQPQQQVVIALVVSLILKAITRPTLHQLGMQLVQAFNLPIGGPNDSFVNMTALIDTDIAGCMLKRRSFSHHYPTAERQLADAIGGDYANLTTGRPFSHPVHWVLVDAVFFLLEKAKCTPILLHALTVNGAVYCLYILKTNDSQLTIGQAHQPVALQPVEQVCVTLLLQCLSHAAA